MPADVWARCSLADYIALQADYARNGPPMRLMLALYVGWKPKRPAAGGDLLSPADFANFLAGFDGSARVSPPSGDGGV